MNYWEIRKWVTILPDTPAGIILFGGYDTGKFQGDLTLLDIQPDAETGKVRDLTVAWVSLSLTDPVNGTNNFGSGGFQYPAILDSGTSLTFLPEDLYQEVEDFVGGVVRDPELPDIPLVDCEQFGSYQGTLDFGFGGPDGPVISVPFSELTLPLLDGAGNPILFSNTCRFGIQPTLNGEPILFGDTFLRSSYVLYDLDNMLIGVAPAIWNSDQTNVIEVVSGKVPTVRASKFENGVSVSQTATGIPRTRTATNLPSAAPTECDSTTGPSTTIAGATETATGASGFGLWRTHQSLY
jgi:hypothetical protein